MTNIILHSTGAVTLLENSANNCEIKRVLILKNGTAVTCTIAGVSDESGNAVSIVLTGSTTVDTIYELDLVNTKSQFSLTASVADKVIVSYCRS